MFGEGDDLWHTSVSNFIHTDGQTRNSTNISSNFCQFHSYFLWMGKPRNSREFATIETCAAVRKYMLVKPQQVTLVPYSDQTATMLQSREPLPFSQTHSRMKLTKTLPSPVPFHRFTHAPAPGRSWAPHVPELIRCVLLLQQHETREYTTKPK
jgi:hypothetical protein